MNYFRTLMMPEGYCVLRVLALRAIHGVVLCGGCMQVHDNSSLIMLLGDSITEAFDTGTLLPEYRIVNRGEYGNNSRGLLTRVRKELTETAPQLVCILIGTNDFAAGIPVDETLRNIKDIIAIVKDYLLPEHVCVISVLPTCDIENRPTPAIDRLNEAIMQLSGLEGVRYFDLNHEMKDSEGKLHRTYTTDGLHISVQGYTVWSRCMQNLLNQMLENK